MILPLGPQNAFVMNQGIRRQYHLMIALLCALSDLLLICAGIFGGSALLMQSPWLLAYAVLGPLVHAGLALALAWLAQVPAGDAALLMVLAASASYIAVPAVVRYAIPEADPSLYVSLSLGVTFPLNILVGIPLYTQVVLRLWGG